MQNSQDYFYAQRNSQQQQGQAPSTLRTVTMAEFRRVPLPPMAEAPMLSSQNSTSSSASASASSLEMWEKDLEERLSSIDHDMNNNKFGSGELKSMFHQGKVEDMDF
ncbi:hypothetical protein SUVZ_13G0830 [Saccharomyces uvarum]|uniref:Uncharacterized protein n=1 Tax=Saccharomyces uvarum TaxID=230603 RepID=A0ABN8WHX8_SACUV|nr:hypothetical protein SUVZ_13G0830 [Saccharomyces uvarum]